MTKAERTAASILEAAEALFLARPYADVTVDQIAGESGLTKGAIYHHFSSKEELYLQLMERAFAEMRQVFAAALSSRGSCRERLERLTRAFFALPDSRIGLMRLVRRDVNGFPRALREKLVRSYQAALPALLELAIREGIAAGELRRADPRLLAWSFVAAVEVTLGRYSDSVFPDREAKLDYVLDLFFHGATPLKERTCA